MGEPIPDIASPPPPPAIPIIDFDGALLALNLLKNGGFEYQESWNTLPSGGATRIDATSNATAHDGSSFVLVRNGNTSTGSIIQDVGVAYSQNDSATYSIWLRRPVGQSPGGDDASVCLWALEHLKNACAIAHLTDQWQRVEATLTMPAATATLRAEVYVTAGKAVELDGAAVTPNLLKDGGFDAQGVGWAVISATGVTNFVTYENGSAHDGGRFAEANTNVSDGSVYQDIGVAPAQDDSASFSLWVRSAPGQAAASDVVNVCLWALWTGRNSCAARTPTDQWQEIEVTLTMPSGTTGLRAQVYLPATGRNIDFDGASVTTNLLRDGGFESQGVGWGVQPAGAATTLGMVADSTAHDGAYYATATSGQPGFIYQEALRSFASRDSATLSLWTRLSSQTASSEEPVKVCLAAVGHLVSACGLVQPSKDWQRSEVTLSMPSATTALRAEAHLPTK